MKPPPLPGIRLTLLSNGGALMTLKKVSAHDLRRTFYAIALKNGIELWKAKLLLNHQESGVTVKHYVETSDLRYFKPEVNTITEWVVEQAKIAKIENIIPMTTENGHKN